MHQIHQAFPHVIQKWYAIDLSCVSSAQSLSGVLDILMDVANDNSLVDNLFSSTAVQIKNEGIEGLCGSVGNNTFTEWIKTKVAEWVQIIGRLSAVANNDPQAGYNCYVVIANISGCMCFNHVMKQSRFH
ncbi:hypothetical protein GJ496_004627 [Pomphorhynchus laevis]|nr:hypothetical protein GJ496_002842 [Pomphorhynchus laevis]KAI0987997.1 hypothetical protein GJ496_004627 [Pomphorhynchus laevis]